MSILVNHDISSYFELNGWAIRKLQEAGSSWKATKHINYAGESYRVSIMNSVVVRGGEFKEEFVVVFTISHPDLDVEVRKTFFTPEEIKNAEQDMVDHIGKYVVAIAEAH